MAVIRVINKTIAYVKIVLMTVLNGNIILPQNFNIILQHSVCNLHKHQFSKSFRVQVTMDSLQHEAHTKIIRNRLYFMMVKFSLFHLFGVE